MDMLTNLAALGDVITVDVSVNNLDVSGGSETLTLINALQNNHGWSINYSSQRQAPMVTSEPVAANASAYGDAVFNVAPIPARRRTFITNGISKAFRWATAGTSPAR